MIVKLMRIYLRRLKTESESINFFQAVSVLGQQQFSAALPQRAPVRWRHDTPLNTVVMFVPQQEAWVVERMGKFHRVLEPGLNVLIPVSIPIFFNSMAGSPFMIPSRILSLITMTS